MIIKIKIPKEALFECPTCSKSFATGKGLGGHKRVHMEKNNKRNHDTMELGVGENGEKTLVSCPICPKTFPSEKSLHGHMRKHSDRSWRGMRPPLPPPLSLSLPLLLPPLPSHEALPVEVEALPSNSSALDHEAISLAHNLLALASAQPSRSVMGGNSLFVNDGVGFHQIPMKSKDKFYCDICGKMFRSYHALGGHKSHHSFEAKKLARLYTEQPREYNRVVEVAVEKPEAENANKTRPMFDLNELPPESRADFRGESN